jgi:hypothetical protein
MAVQAWLTHQIFPVLEILKKTAHLQGFQMRRRGRSGVNRMFKLLHMSLDSCSIYSTVPVAYV